MAILQGFLHTAIDSNHFSYHKGSLSAEASDLTGRNLEQRIYDDAMDVGFAVRSVNTGQVIGYYLSQEHKREGDVTHWTYKPIPEHARRYPECANTTVIIFND